MTEEEFLETMQRFGREQDEKYLARCRERLARDEAAGNVFGAQYYRELIAEAEADPV